VSDALAEVQRALIRIGSAARCGDIDSALRDERMLHLKALQAIAGGAKDAQRIAATALLSTDLQFDRG
jgi:hypothetical protein